MVEQPLTSIERYKKRIMMLYMLIVKESIKREGSKIYV